MVLLNLDEDLNPLKELFKSVHGIAECLTQVPQAGWNTCVSDNYGCFSELLEPLCALLDVNETLDSC